MNAADRTKSPLPVRYPYDAFVSYSHAADSLLAPALQSSLEKLAKPWYRLRALRVFRDVTDVFERRSATKLRWLIGRKPVQPYEVAALR